MEFVFRLLDRDCQRLNIPVMHISLTPELENAVKSKVKSGLYNNASEVVREALRQSLAREQENSWLAREAAIGFAQLESGQTTSVESKEQFFAMVREDP
jgi:antitoxin ParD1/3/4